MCHEEGSPTHDFILISNESQRKTIGEITRSNLAQDVEPARRIEMVSKALSGKESVVKQVLIGAKEFTVTLTSRVDGVILLEMVDGDYRVGTTQEVFRFRFDCSGRLLKARSEAGVVRPNITDAAADRGWLVPSQHFSPSISFADRALLRMSE